MGSAPVLRVVSLCPSLTETVVVLGRGDTLVGRTKFCIHPADALAHVPRVGGTKNPKLDQIVALRPDLVLMNDEENRAEDAAALTAAGVRTWSALPRDAAGAAAQVRSLGVALDARDEAEQLALEIEKRAERVRSAVSSASTPVRFAYLIWRAPWMAVNGDTYISGLLALAGGVNVFAADTARYPEVSAAQLAEASPARVLLSSEPFPFAEKHADELAAATGIAREAIVLVDGERLSWHGARTPAGIDYAAAIIAGGSLLPSEEVAKMWPNGTQRR